MKPYLFLPLLAVTALAAEPVMAQRPSAYQGGSVAATSRPTTVRSHARHAGHHHHRHHGHRGHHHRAHHRGHHHHHGHHHGHHRQWQHQPPTYPANFGNYGYNANYNTPYYRQGFRQSATSPYGFPATYQSPYGYPLPRQNRIFSYGTSAGFHPYTGPSNYTRSNNTYSYYSPYYRGQAYPGYRGYGVYGPNGAYTVPGAGVGTAAVQSRLLQTGYYRGPVDGFAGPLTRSAIRSYQYQHGIPVTGRIDGHLIRSMQERSGYIHR